MGKIDKVSIIGLGGIGGAFASMIHDIDPGVLKVITNKERSDRYTQKGFLINGKQYQFQYVHPQQRVELADLILITVKYNQLEQAILDISNHVGPNTIILPLLNGITSEEIVAKKYGMDKVLYGMVIGIDAIRKDNDIQFSTRGKIHFGEKNNINYSQKVKTVKNFFDRIGICYEIPNDMIRDLWWKFMVNVGVNQTSSVLKAPYKVFHEIQEAEDLLRLVMMEVLRLSKKANVRLDEKDIDKFISILKELSPQGKTSMLQDIEASRKTEVEMLAGVVCKLGEKYNVDVPINKMLLKMIQTMEKM